VPNCYFLAVCSGSSVDQQSNNVSLFSLVEQVNVPPNAPAPPRGVIPLEIHAYWRVDPSEVGEEFETRFVMEATTGLETPGPTFRHRPSVGRFRTRVMGVPYPPVLGDYTLHVDWRGDENAAWQRVGITWPMSLRQLERRPTTTH
jgi:hypothetical protein